MDEVDQRILSELQNRGFQKSTALASVLSIGERTIRRRLSNMISEGMIKIIAVPNPVSFGYRAWAKIGIKVAREALNRVARVLVEHPSIYFVAYAFGRFDIIIAVHLDTIEKLTHFVNSELTKVKGILSAETMILSSPRKYYHFSWPEPTFEKTKDPWNPYQDANVRHGYKRDEVDQRILDVLREDGLTRTKSLKLKLGIGENTIRKHIRNMLDNEVYKLEVVPNPALLENEMWATTGIVINHKFVHRMMKHIVEHPAVYLASAALGRFNIIIATRFHNAELLHQFLAVDLQSMPGISFIETAIHNKPLKYHNIIWSTFESTGVGWI